MPNIHAKYQINWRADNVDDELKNWHNDEIDSVMWDSPNLVDTEMKFHSGKGKKYAAQRKYHLLEWNLLPDLVPYRGKRKPNLTIEFDFVWIGDSLHRSDLLSENQIGSILSQSHIQIFDIAKLINHYAGDVIESIPIRAYRADIGNIALTVTQRDDGLWYSVAKYCHKVVTRAYGKTPHKSLHNLFSRRTWYLLGDGSHQWVGLDWLYRNIHIRFPTSRNPRPVHTIYTLDDSHLYHKGRFRWS